MMTNEERLREIKDNVDRIDELPSRKLDGEVIYEDMKWLIERVQELEDENLRTHQEMHDLRKREKTWYKTAEDKALQSQRYEQALEFYADEENWEEKRVGSEYMTDSVKEIDSDLGDKARKALEVITHER